MSLSPLAGIRVVDLSIVWAGPHCTRLLADMGAEVIKVESRRQFDPIRGPAQPGHPADGCYPDNEPGERPYNRHGYFNERNRNKLGLCLDLRHRRGREAFLRLVAVSDVVVENFSAGTMDHLGLGYQALRALRPQLIMALMPSFGCTGPESHYVGYGATNDQLRCWPTPICGHAASSRRSHTRRPAHTTTWAWPGACRVRQAAPCLGEHSERVLKEIAGLSDDEFERLLSAAITGAAALPPSPNR